MKRSTKTILLLVNPNSGQRRVNKIIAAVTREFHGPVWKLLVKILSSAEEAYVLARESSRKGYFAVLVAGGDGTINEVARALAGRKTALAIIPAGTGNSFARALGIPLHINMACKIASQGRRLKVDLGKLDQDRVFVSICGAGFDAFAARLANQLRWLNSLSGFIRYLISGILTAVAFRPQILRITVDSKVYEGPCLLVTVANGKQYGFEAIIAPDARLDDGKLDVVIIPPAGIFTLLINSIRLFTLKPMSSVIRMQGKKIRIEGISGTESPVHIDGESAGRSPIQISVIPRALSVIVP